MKKLAALVPVALLAALTGCSGSAVQTTSEDVGEADQAITEAASWTGLPGSDANWSSCVWSSSTLQYSMQVKLDAVEPGSVDAYDVVVYIQDSNGNAVYSTTSQPNDTLTPGGAPLNFTDSNGSSFSLIAGTDAHGHMTLAMQNAYFSYDGTTIACTPHVVLATAFASSVGVAGRPWMGSTLTGNYTFSDNEGLPQSGSTFQWYRLSGGTATAISGATSTTYTPTSADVGDPLQFCVTPSDANGAGAQVCSSPTVPVPGVVWFSAESWTGTAKGEISVNGTCVTVSSLALGFTPASLILYSVDDLVTNIDMYDGANCTGDVYNRYTGNGTEHDINLDTVGIGSNLVSYRITW